MNTRSRKTADPAEPDPAPAPAVRPAHGGRGGSYVIRKGSAERTLVACTKAAPPTHRKPTGD